MIIGFDASRATRSFGRGTEHYSKHLLIALSNIDKKNTYICYTSLPPRGELGELPSNFRWRVIPFPRLWSQVRLSFEFLRGRDALDLLFVPAHIIPLVHPQKTVITVHDLGFVYRPDLYTPFERFYHPASIGYSIRVASHIIVPSEATARDLETVYGIERGKISVIAEAPVHSLFSPRNTRDQGKYIFSIGSLEAKKNTKRLIEAYHLLRRDPTINHKLVLVGKPGWRYQEVEKVISLLPSNIRDDIDLKGYISDQEAARLLKGADISVFVSLFEGFGIPILESQAAGVPLLTSNRTACPEVAADAALFVDPEDVAAIARGMRRLILDRRLRQRLKQRGLRRARQFSWNKTARATLAVLERVGRA